MKFGGIYLFYSDRDAVWRGLNNVDVLKEVIPRCETIAWSSQSTLDLTIKVNLGIAHPKFSGELELSNVVEAKSYTLSGKGHGGLLGLAHGAADIELRDHRLISSDLDHFETNGRAIEQQPGDAGTVLSFGAHGTGSRQIMALGSSIIGKSAQKVIDRFMSRFSAAMDIPMRPMNEKFTEQA